MRIRIVARERLHCGRESTHKEGTANDKFPQSEGDLIAESFSSTKIVI